MKLSKISALIMVIACASATDQNMFESDDRIVAYIGGSSEIAHKTEPRINVSEKDERKVAEPGRTIRALTNSNSLETSIKNNSSEAYYFDYLVKDPQGNVHFHIQQKYENGTVKGMYALGEDKVRYLIVRYVADDKGYRATIEKDESDHSKQVGLKAHRSNGKITYQHWGIRGLAVSVGNLYTPGKDLKSDEDEDED